MLAFQLVDYLFFGLPTRSKNLLLLSFVSQYPTQLEWGKVNSLSLSDLFLLLFSTPFSYSFLLSFSYLKDVRFHEKFCDAFGNFSSFSFLNQHFVKPSFHFIKITLGSNNISKFYFVIFQNYLIKDFVFIMLTSAHKHLHFTVYIMYSL